MKTAHHCPTLKDKVGQVHNLPFCEKRYSFADHNKQQGKAVFIHAIITNYRLSCHFTLPVSCKTHNYQFIRFTYWYFKKLETENKDSFI